MIISERLKNVASLVEKCSSMADIGTDHAYIPIYLVKNKICESAIASDINEGPVEKARKNIALEGLTDYIECRLGGGLSTIKPGEVQCAVIAGMGGNLIRDILNDGAAVVKSLDTIIMQPVQNPEVLRKYLYLSGYDIIDEELTFEDGKYYEIIKAKYDTKQHDVDEIFYEIGYKLIEKRHPLICDYINFKLNKCYKICESIEENTEGARKRKLEVENRISGLKELLKKCL